MSVALMPCVHLSRLLRYRFYLPGPPVIRLGPAAGQDAKAIRDGAFSIRERQYQLGTAGTSELVSRRARGVIVDVARSFEYSCATSAVLSLAAGQLERKVATENSDRTRDQVTGIRLRGLQAATKEMAAPGLLLSGI